MMRVLENMTNEEWPKKLCCVSLQKRRLTEDTIRVFQNVKGCYKEDSDQLFLLFTGERTKTNQLNLQQRFRLDREKKKIKKLPIYKVSRTSGSPFLAFKNRLNKLPLRLV